MTEQVEDRKMHPDWTPSFDASLASAIAAAKFRAREGRPPRMVLRGLIGDLQRLLRGLEGESPL